MKQDCRGCTKRKVGCHSTCQEYIVAKAINTYKRKKQREIDRLVNGYDPIVGATKTSRLLKKLNG